MRLPSHLALTLVLAPASAIAAEVLWRGDFEIGDTKLWNGAPKADGIKVGTEPGRIETETPVLRFSWFL
ncbi:MAG TPA: hypothetical protein VKE40_06005 [Gemmataceae bacterium]|nr:hypothetical protein [Gemmataceae bacterium]